MLAKAYKKLKELIEKNTINAEAQQKAMLELEQQIAAILNMQSELEAANKANEKLDFDSEIDDKFGANASSTMNETLANSGEQGSASRLGAEGAYKRGLTQAHNANGADGVSSFENQMKESSQNNWNGGSAQSEAMKIGSEIAKGGAPTSQPVSGGKTKGDGKV